MARVDELRLMAKVARMYYLQDLNQQAITERLQLHQSTISRILKKARTMNLIRFSIATPPGTFADLEDQLTSRFELRDAVVVDSPPEGEAMVRDLGAALAYFLETTLKPGKIVGISSWSRSLFAMVDALHPGSYCAGGKVVQILGGVGNVGRPAASVPLRCPFSLRLFSDRLKHSVSSLAITPCRKQPLCSTSWISRWWELVPWSPQKCSRPAATFSLGKSAPCCKVKEPWETFASASSTRMESP
jgi:hypothetical protein